MSLSLKKCTDADLDTLAFVSRKTFVDAFEALNDPEDFKQYVDKAFSKAQLASELANSHSFFFLAYKDNELVGYLKLNESMAQTDVRDGKSMELERIYVLRAFQGQKIGEWLIDEVKGMARERHKDFLWLGVWEKNTQAIKFYERQGFSKFGTHPYFIGNDEQTDWLMRWQVNRRPKN
ncbi:GNAT family N-acetyltransferase [Pseudozobellia thermophila]|uniref:Ribosomal protein S18 acetylase RimI n=1 Tax=Pseudozobellia thermophila TaxID=192903 RepID=A0A1M6BTY2_9FLAO|nr:GNAT family N-acetyltransferase [Pseudozobellia thermophila]SHI51968.1 Ribosomal protein S18 acetylase RimI [Pseudozobellia thermophila]